MRPNLHHEFAALGERESAGDEDGTDDRPQHYRLSKDDPAVAARAVGVVAKSEV